MAVIAVGQVDADFLGGLHLELVHCLPGLGDVELVVIVAHNRSLLLSFSPEIPTDFRRNRLLFRNHSMTRVGRAMNGDWRKGWKRMTEEILDICKGGEPAEWQRHCGGAVWLIGYIPDMASGAAEQRMEVQTSKNILERRKLEAAEGKHL